MLIKSLPTYILTADIQWLVLVFNSKKLEAEKLKCCDGNLDSPSSSFVLKH